MRKNKKFKVFIIGMMLSVMMIPATALAANTNYKSFSDVKLPNEHDNTTLASAKKTTSTKYGQVKISDYTSSEGVNVWFRSYSGGDWHYYLPYVVSFTSKTTKNVYYCDASSSYYAKGTSVQLRAEDRANTILFQNKVTGSVYFN